MTTVTMIGVSGAQYIYYVAGKLDSWKDAAGNYAFAYLAANGKWTILYIGQCDSFCNRICSHSRWEEAVKLGATHVLNHLNPVESARLAEEQDLIAKYNPPLNTHHRVVPAPLTLADLLFPKK